MCLINNSVIYLYKILELRIFKEKFAGFFYVN